MTYMSFIYLLVHHCLCLRVRGTDIFTCLKCLELESLQLKRLDGEGEYACELQTPIHSNLAQYKLGNACPPIDAEKLLQIQQEANNILNKIYRRKIIL